MTQELGTPSILLFVSTFRIQRYSPNIDIRNNTQEETEQYFVENRSEATRLSFSVEITLRLQMKRLRLL